MPNDWGWNHNDKFYLGECSQILSDIFFEFGLRRLVVALSSTKLVSRVRIGQIAGQARRGKSASKLAHSKIKSNFKYAWLAVS